MPKLSGNFQEVPLKIVGSSKFGQYTKISSEKTYNMYISDDWLVPFPGHQRINNLNALQGRGIYRSTKYDHMIQVSDNVVYAIDSRLTEVIVGRIDTFIGDVFIAENNVGQIAICDKTAIWIFDYLANTFQKATLDFIPGHVSSQNGRFIATVLDGNTWRITSVGNGLNWPNDAQHVGAFATNDTPVASVPIPGLENNLLIMGKVHTQLWVDVGAQLFPYQKSSGFNIDYGTLNPACIAALDKHIVWVGQNSQSGPTIIMSTGADIQRISTDGIDFEFGRLVEPTNCYGFLFKQDGHLFYLVTFPGDADNLSLLFDFNTQSFFNLTDEDMDYHIAKRIAFFNNSYFFVSFKDGNTYNMDSQFTNYDGAEIPRIRIPANFRNADSSPFVVPSATITVDSGYTNDEQRIDMSISTNGGASFSSYVPRYIRPMGLRKNMVNWFSLGRSNDFVVQFRFFGLDRFLAADGVMTVYQ